MILTYIMAFVGLVLAFLGMGAALHFARYKRRGACCSQRLAQSDQAGKHDCDVCACAPPLP